MTDGRELEPAIVALAGIVRGSDAEQRLRADPEAWLRGAGVDGEDLAQMLALGAERMLVYRTLVHNRLRHAVRDSMPRTWARLGRPHMFQQFASFMGARGPRSVYLREVPREFLDWVAPRWRADAYVPAFLIDLANHEVAEREVKDDPAGPGEPTGLPLELEGRVAFAGAVRLMRHDHAVHELPLDEADRTSPRSTPTALLLYRDAAHDVRFLSLIPLAAALIDRLMTCGDTLRDAVIAACDQVGHAMDDERLSQAAVLLSDLMERNVVLGAVP